MFTTKTPFNPSPPFDVDSMLKRLMGRDEKSVEQELREIVPWKAQVACNELRLKIGMVAACDPELLVHFHDPLVDLVSYLEELMELGKVQAALKEKAAPQSPTKPAEPTVA